MPKHLFHDSIFKTVKVISESLILDMPIDIGYMIRLVLVEQTLLEFWVYWKRGCVWLVLWFFF